MSYVIQLTKAVPHPASRLQAMDECCYEQGVCEEACDDYDTEDVDNRDARPGDSPRDSSRRTPLGSVSNQRNDGRPKNGLGFPLAPGRCSGSRHPTCDRRRSRFATAAPVDYRTADPLDERSSCQPQGGCLKA